MKSVHTIKLLTPLICGKCQEKKKEVGMCRNDNFEFQDILGEAYGFGMGQNK